MRLSNSKMAQIAEHLILPLRDKEKYLLEGIQQVATGYVLALIPDDVKQMADKYPQLNNITVYIPFNTLKLDIKASNFPTMQLLLPMGSLYFGKDVNSIANYISSCSKVVKGIRKLADLMKTRKETYNRIMCTLTDLGTDNALRKEFPEAYKALKIVEGGDTLTGCDRIEKLRADLSALNKKTNESK